MLSKINKILLLITALVISVFSTYAQNTPKSYKILGISVEGNYFADEQTIRALSGLREGEQMNIPTDDKLRLALKNLWQRKQFSDVTIEIEKISPIGIFLVIKVKEFPRLSEIDVENNVEVSKEDIIKAIGKIRGDIMSQYDVYLAKQAVKALYAKEGYMFAKVNAELEPTDTIAYSRLVIDVVEGVEFYVESIEFEGNSAYDDDELADAFDDTHSKHWWQFWKSSKFNLKEYEKDKELLDKFYKRNGFIDAELIKDSLYYDDENEKVKIKIDVYEGSRLFVRDISFEGNTVYSSDYLLKRLDFKKGDPYDIERFTLNLTGNPESTDAASLYMDNGYLMVRLVPEEKRIQPDSVDILVKVFENQRVKYRRIDIVGNTKTKDKVIRRELYTRPGDYFDRSAVIRSVRALGVMQYFNTETLRPDVKPVDDANVDLVYKVEERSSDQINASIGLAGSFGLMGSVGLTLNNFSLAEPLKGGAGQIFNISAEFGQASRYQTFSIGFTEPWLFDEPTTVGFSLYYRWIRYFYNLRTRGGTFNIGRRFRWPDDYFRGNWSIRIQDNFVEGTTGYYYPPGLTTEITLGQTITRLSMDNLFFPTVGSRFSISTDFAMGSIGLGKTDFLKNELKFELANPLMQIDGNNRLVLFLSSNFGYITGLQSDSTITPIERYYMGGNGLGMFGVTPLRGYTDRAVGPQLDDYNSGKVLAKHIAELRFAVSMDPYPVYFYVFGEAGNIWNSLRDTDLFNLKRSAGIGVQLSVPALGVLGFSYGYGFDSPGPTGSKSGWQFLFHLGQQ